MSWKDIRDAAHAQGDGWGFWLCDKHMEPLEDLHGALDMEASEEVNETTVFKATLRGDHPAVNSLLALDQIDEDAPQLTWSQLVDEAQWIIVEGPGGQSERLVYRVHRITDRVDGGPGEVTIEAKSLYRYVESIALRANPASSLLVQLRYNDIRAGDSLRILKEFLLVNLMRDFQPRAITGWDLWSQSAWQAVNPNLWAAVVNPVHASTSTQWTFLDARFDMAADMFKETLDAAGLMLTVDLWLPGDEQPAPAHLTLTLPTLWIDVVPRQFDTSTTGTALDFFHGLVRQFSVENNAPALGMGDTTATHAGVLPWVVWRPEHMSGITSDFTVVKSEFAHVTVGGRSPEVINQMIGAGSKALFQGLAAALAAAIPVFGPLIVAAGTFLGELSAEALKDKLFAWQEFEHAVRKAAHGRFAYRDQVGAGDGWTLSAMQQGFSMLAQGAGMISVGFDAGEQDVFLWGRDFRAGDQQGLEHRGIIFATYVSGVKLSWSVERGFTQNVQLGDPRARESWVRGYNRSLKGISNAVSRVKTLAL